MYNIGDKLEYDNQCWQVERRFKPFSEREYSNHHHIDTIGIVTDIDTDYSYTLVSCHADQFGLMQAENELIELLPMLYNPMLLTCHPGLVLSNYDYSPLVVYSVGNWTGETIAFMTDGILYICSNTTIQ